MVVSEECVGGKQLLPGPQNAEDDTAMEAGVAGHICTIGELIDLICQSQPSQTYFGFTGTALAQV
jgi:hypothetical protein